MEGQIVFMFLFIIVWISKCCIRWTANVCERVIKSNRNTPSEQFLSWIWLAIPERKQGKFWPAKGATITVYFSWADWPTKPSFRRQKSNSLNVDHNTVLSSIVETGISDWNEELDNWKIGKWKQHVILLSKIRYAFLKKIELQLAHLDFPLETEWISSLF